MASLMQPPRYCKTRYPTLYELAAIHPDGRRYLLAYCRIKSRSSLWDTVTSENRVHHIVALVGTKSIDFAQRAADGATMGEWSIRFTGRTARECQGSEHPFIVTVAAPEGGAS